MEWVFLLVGVVAVYLWLRPRRAARDAFVIDVVGESHDNYDGTSRQKIIAGLRAGEAVALVAEPTNRYDDKAVAVVSRRGQIGYLPAGRCHDVFRRLAAGEEVAATIEHIGGGTRDKPSYGVWIEIARS